MSTSPYIYSWGHVMSTSPYIDICMVDIIMSVNIYCIYIGIYTR